MDAWTIRKLHTGTLRHIHNLTVGHWDTWTLRHFDTWTLRHLDTYTLGHFHTGTLGHLDTWSLRHLDTWTLGRYVHTHLIRHGTDAIDETDLHFGEVILELSVHHRHRLHAEKLALLVALRVEL